MRVLSQEGRTFNDVPYENLCFGISKHWDEGRFCIMASKNPILERNYGEEYVFAIYSSQEKAKKAMEMLRNAYSPKIEIKEVKDKDIPKPRAGDWVWRISEPKVEVFDNFYFQFPADEEIEV